MTQPPLPAHGMPDAPPVRHKRSTSPCGRITYTRHHFRRRVLCDDCVRAVHTLGPAVAPLPRTVRWKRVDGNGFVAFLCDPCKDIREETDR